MFRYALYLQAFFPILSSPFLAPFITSTSSLILALYVCILQLLVGIAFHCSWVINYWLIVTFILYTKMLLFVFFVLMDIFWRYDNTNFPISNLIVFYSKIKHLANCNLFSAIVPNFLHYPSSSFLYRCILLWIFIQHLLHGQFPYNL